MNINYKKILENDINRKIVEEKKGASGVIYIVDNGENTFPRKITFKSVRVDKLSKEKKSHFIEECELWFKIYNNYLVKPFYSKIIDDLPFICMPYYELDLKSFMLSKNLTEVEALVLSVQLSKALWEMQKSGVDYHQDFNPPNVLIEDLSKSFSDCSTSNCINYAVKISDFGIANLIKKIGPTEGGNGGKFPFKAPEQYNPKGYASYNPDIFALGVIIYMLFTNKHPNGLSKVKALNKNTSSSEFKKWVFNAKIDLENGIIEQLINQTLDENPSNRPSAEELYKVLMEELKKLNQNTSENLKLRFDYFDNLNGFDTISKEIDILSSLSKLPNNKINIYNHVKLIVSNLLDKVNSEEELISLCKYYKLLTSIAIINQDKSYLTKYSEKLIELLHKWHAKIKAHHEYPENIFRGNVIVKTPDIRDIEIVSEYILVIYFYIRNHMNENEIKNLFEKYNDDIFFSIFLYSKASIIKSDIYTCISLLEKAKHLNSKEPLFDYMKYLWLRHYLILKKDEKLEKIKDITYISLKNDYKNWKAIDKL